jgi:hypothetical protein
MKAILRALFVLAVLLYSSGYSKSQRELLDELKMNLQEFDRLASKTNEPTVSGRPELEEIKNNLLAIKREVIVHPVRESCQFLKIIRTIKT